MLSYLGKDTSNIHKIRRQLDDLPKCLNIHCMYENHCMFQIRSTKSIFSMNLLFMKCFYPLMKYIFPTSGTILAMTDKNVSKKKRKKRKK